MASPFVPVDLDKLLDEFEEKEGETKPEQLASAGAIDTTCRKQLTKRNFQAPFPSIEEEVLSDQGSVRHISDDASDSGTDSDSISGVIKEAEAITNQRLLAYQPQTLPDTVDEDINNELKGNVVIEGHTPSETFNGNDVSICIEESHTRGFDLDKEKCLNQHGHAQLLNEESEAVNVPASFATSEKQDIMSNNNQGYFTEIESTSDVLVPSSELFDKHTTISTAKQERPQAVEEKLNPVKPGVADVDPNDSLTKLNDSTVGPSEPEISSVAIAAGSEAYFAECDQVLQRQGSLKEPTEHVPGLLGKQARNGLGSSNGDFQDVHISEQSAGVAKTCLFNPVMLTDSTSEAASETTSMPAEAVLVSDISHSEGYEHSSIVDDDLQSTILYQEQSQMVQLDQPGASSVSMTTDSMGYRAEVNESSDDEVQATLGDQAGTSNLTQSGPSQDEPSSAEYDQVYEASGVDAGMLPFSNEYLDEQMQLPSQAPEPDLTIAMQSQESLEARRITAGEANLGKVPPIWVPDSVATHCMNCGLKFSVIKRRHHCRACGKALCSSCCNMKFVLPYLDNKEGRVCQVCCNALLRAQALLQVVENQSVENLRMDNESPTEDLMLDDGLEEDEESVPADQEEVMETAEAVGDDDTADFAGAEVDVTSEQSAPVLPPLQLPVMLPPDFAGTPLSTPTSPALSDDSDCLFRLDVDNVRSLLPQDITALPPVLKVVNEEVSIQERPDPAEIMYQLKGLHETVLFLLNKNLVVKVNIVKLSCCLKRKCWCFVTEGMGAANQEEMVVLLECLRKETMLPKDVLSHFNTAFAYAKQGHTVSELGYTIFGQPFLGSNDNAGFLYVKPTYQCLKNLPLPSTPYVVGILIKRPETPWAQLFPLRLQLRLGAEYRYYPCPLFSSRNRSAVYGEVGHTIMNLLADFKNFQYTLARVTGLVIHMEEKKTLVRLPQDRYDEVLKILNAADEHVMALGANFSLQADSHLVCIQSEQGYKTQAINIQNQPRRVTGASFIVFSGALKTSSPFMAKVSIVEDGIMVQLLPEAIAKLRNSLKEMKDYTITTGIPGGGGEEQVVIEWVSRQDAPHQSSLTSPIDGLQLEGFPSVKVHTGYDFTRKSVFRIQWTEMFFLGDRQQTASRDINKLTAELAQAFCRTLMSHLSKLNSDDFTCIGLRVNLDSDNVGYVTGSNQQSLPTSIMSQLDDVLVPVIHNAASHHRRRSVNVELLFKVLRLL